MDVTQKIQDLCMSVYFVMIFYIAHLVTVIDVTWLPSLIQTFVQILNVVRNIILSVRWSN